MSVQVPFLGAWPMPLWVSLALSDFVDRFGPRLAHLNTMLAVLRPLAAANLNNAAKKAAE